MLTRDMSLRHALMLVFFGFIGMAGCAQRQDGPYAPTKQSWDSPPTGQELQELRHRAETTQQDH